jgi:hypothetical protein
MRRMLETFGDERFRRLAYISNGHFYNVRNSTAYRRRPLLSHKLLMGSRV